MYGSSQIPALLSNGLQIISHLLGKVVASVSKIDVAPVGDSGDCSSRYSDLALDTPI